MAIELSKDTRDRLIGSIERYFEVERGERLGNIAAGALLGFFLEELGPVVFNRAVAQAQEQMQMRVSEIDIEVHEDEFGYWPKYDKATGRGRR